MLLSSFGTLYVNIFYFKIMSNTLKWLSAIGVEYYCSEHPPKLKVCNNTELTEKSQVKLMSTKKTAFNTNRNLSKFPYREEFKGDTSPRTSAYTKVCEVEGLGSASKFPLEVGCGKISNDKVHDNITLARSLADNANNIEELKESLLNFNGCELKKFATNTVFGDGNLEAKIMLIGEAPGSTEDLKGIPFCGESGNLLDNMLHAIGISRKNNAYITNTVFWRPPANRQPTLEEVDICKPFVEKHIALISPKLIILVGSTATTSLLGKNSGITKIRQEYYFYTNKYLSAPIETTAIFHPAYLLRQPMQKRTSWYDLLKIKEYLVNTGLLIN
ncbi:uracil-DNA glycosylase [Candidatus Rickettsia kedanie]|uniref:Type-4 uracil-DNA glycosylase n=2 Tax=Candidatus Rickettsia kedanie TaxID=3115352 RepID=A0ABP9TUR7_9RICK